jgi:hypothetical protein
MEHDTEGIGQQDKETVTSDCRVQATAFPPTEVDATLEQTDSRPAQQSILRAYPTAYHMRSAQ